MAERRTVRRTRAEDETGLDNDVMAGADRGTRAGARAPGRRGDRELTAAQAAEQGLHRIAELTGKPAEGVTGVEPAEDGWIIGVEVVEDRRVPSSADLLATYEAELDLSGELLSYRRIRRYARGRGDNGKET